VKLRLVPQLDFIIFFASLVLVIFGVAFIYSAGVDSSGVSISNEYVKQILFAISGLVPLFLAFFVDLRKYTRYCTVLYAILNLVLLYTCRFGKVVNGARSWLGIGIFGIQPSEFGKIVFILFFAWYLDISKTMPPFRRFLFALVFLCLPVGLILLQPDLGTSSVYVPIFLCMCFFAGIPFRYLLVLVSCGLLTIFFTVLPVWATEIYRQPLPIIQIFQNYRLRLIVLGAAGFIAIIGYTGYRQFRNRYYRVISQVFAIITCALLGSAATGRVLKEYQIKRLIVFLDPNIDPLGAGWNIIQSKVAIGSGNLFGQGFLKGTQSHYRFLPQHNTDFIFSILSEEWGFAGGMAVFALYFLILMRISFIIRNTSNLFASSIAVGIFGMFFFHFIVNIGMVMGVMPITGIPLLFLSYGGSSLWTAMTCVGLLMGIHARRLELSPKL
jgi:rod shape determining protein RodA